MWSPDGARLAFASARHQDWDVTPVRDLYAVGADWIDFSQRQFIVRWEGSRFLQEW